MPTPSDRYFTPRKTVGQAAQIQPATNLALGIRLPYCCELVITPGSRAPVSLKQLWLPFVSALISSMLQQYCTDSKCQYYLMIWLSSGPAGSPSTRVSHTCRSICLIIPSPLHAHFWFCSLCHVETSRQTAAVMTRLDTAVPIIR